MDSLLIFIIIIILISGTLFVAMNIIFQSNIEDPLNLNISPQEIIMHFKMLLKKGDYNIAYNLAKKYLEKVPSHYELRYLYAKSMYERGNNINEVIKHMQSVIKYDIKNHDAHLILAKCYDDTGRYKRALEQYRYVLLLDYSNEDALFYIAQMYENMNNKRKALKYYVNFINYSNNKEVIEQVRIKVARLYNEFKKWRELNTITNIILKYDENNLEILCYLKNAQFYLGNLESAQMTLNKCISLDSENYIYYEDMLILLNKMKKYEENIEYCKKALEFKNANVDLIQSILAKAYIETGEIETGNEILKEAMEKSPKDINLKQTLAFSYIKQNKYDESIKILIKLLDEVNIKNIDTLKTQISETYCLWADYLLKSENLDGFFDKLHHALKYNPNNSDIYYKLAKSNFNIKNYKEAITQTKSAIEISPNKCEYYLLLGNLYLALEEIYDAREAFIEACSINPENQEAHISLGMLCLKLKDINTSILHLSAAEKLDVKNIKVKYNLALMYESIGEIEKAIEKYNEVLLIDNDHVEAKNNLKLLSNMHL